MWTVKAVLGKRLCNAVKVREVKKTNDGNFKFRERRLNLVIWFDDRAVRAFVGPKEEKMATFCLLVISQHQKFASTSEIWRNDAPPLTFIVDSTKNLMSGPHRECDRKEHNFSYFKST